MLNKAELQEAAAAEFGKLAPTLEASGVFQYVAIDTAKTLYLCGFITGMRNGLNAVIDSVQLAERNTADETFEDDDYEQTG